MKHKENNCQVPFCGECWKNLKSNIEGIMKVATDLSNPTDEENMKLDAKNIPLPGYFTSNPTEPKPELFNVCRCGLVPFRHVVSFHDVPDVKEREAAQGENQTLRTTSPKEELELEAIRHLIIEAVTPYTFGDDGHLTGLADKDCYQWIDAIIKDVMFKFTRQAAIKELNKLPNHTDINLYVRERISELKADNE